MHIASLTSNSLPSAWYVNGGISVGVLLLPRGRLLQTQVAPVVVVSVEETAQLLTEASAGDIEAKSSDKHELMSRREA